MTPLNKLIRERYGSQKQLAEFLGVAEHTIVRWMKREPTYFLKYAFEMADSDDDQIRLDFLVELGTAVNAQIQIIDAD